jgi:uncharacterized repeat protein (TIGR03803 family)
MTTAKRFGVSHLLSAALCLGLLCLSSSRRVQAQTYTVVHDFAGYPNDGAWPNGDLIQDEAGNLYGTTVGGGTLEGGTVFKLDSSGAVTILHSFTYNQVDDSVDGFEPEAGLFRAPTGDLYGTTSVGGAYRVGTVFKLDTNNVLTTLYSFKGGTDGSSPFSRLVSINGELYGTTLAGGGSGCYEGQGCGTIFKITKGGLETILYRFAGGADGIQPQGLIRDSAGNLYGVTIGGCSQGSLCPAYYGAVFKVDTTGTFTVLYTFTGGADGGAPLGRLIRDTNGNIHGVTISGGDPKCSCGVVFELDASGRESVIRKFFDGYGGSRPNGGLLDVGGTLYGTTDLGGDVSCYSGYDSCGVLYQVGKTGHYTPLHSFAGVTGGDGYFSADNLGSLTLGNDGSIYGATSWGGTYTFCNGEEFAFGCGTIFKYTP